MGSLLVEPTNLFGPSELKLRRESFSVIGDRIPMCQSDDGQFCFDQLDFEEEVDIVLFDSGDTSSLSDDDGSVSDQGDEAAVDVDPFLSSADFAFSGDASHQSERSRKVSLSLDLLLPDIVLPNDDMLGIFHQRQSSPQANYGLRVEDLLKDKSVKRIGIYTVEQRKARIARFHEKRKRRVWRPLKLKKKKLSHSAAKSHKHRAQHHVNWKY
ncbi:unnamed protein product [Heterosigma akashiwo]|mmetsp:Transcript_28706/g.49764  ORF Transcript_28706/g.49764 Transcript_28706/m.49764 type:complete len:212 (+) Transcript_28706:135-770(+)